MVKAIREIVKVGPDRSVRVNAPELVPGTTAEVIVLVESPNGNAANKLEAFRALQDTMKLTREAAEAWVTKATSERHASTRM